MRTFAGFPQFVPNVTPKDVFKKGAYGGTYYRPIDSSVTDTKYTSPSVIREYPKSWWRGIDVARTVTAEVYDKNVNKYGVKCGSSLEFWESKGWIQGQDPYGWFQWYCRFYRGRRTDDDDRQIKRWEKLAGPRGRFRRRLMNEIIKKEMCCAEIYFWYQTAMHTMSAAAAKPTRTQVQTETRLGTCSTSSLASGDLVYSGWCCLPSAESG